MPEVAALAVALHGKRIGTITRVPGDRSIFAFEDSYAENGKRRGASKQ